MIMTCKQLLPFSRLQSQNKNNLLIACRLIEMAASHRSLQSVNDLLPVEFLGAIKKLTTKPMTCE